MGQFSYNAINYRPDQVDEIHFSDGVVWNAADIRSQYLLSMKTAGNDSIYGFWTNDTLDGGQATTTSQVAMAMTPISSAMATDKTSSKRAMALCSIPITTQSGSTATSTLMTSHSNVSATTTC
ncbi:hypothetical protein MF410_00120 (plasmid) [Rhizobium sp. C104]|nr:hypothetical protein MF410_00120 [Rhizobium sp. C104]